MSGPNTNITDRLPMTKDPLQVIDVYSADDLPAAITAPDGVSRRPLSLEAKYLIHNDFVWPRLLVPKATDTSRFQFLVIQGARKNMRMRFDGTVIPHIWGRDIGLFQLNDLIFTDVSNGGTGRGTVLMDLVGSGPFSFFIKQFMIFLNFKKLGTLVDVGIQSSQTFQRGMESGWIHRVNVNTFQNSFVVSLQRMIRSSTDPSMKKPFMVIQGAAPVGVVSNGNIELQTGDTAFHIDSASTGEINILGNSYAGASAGDFFRPDISKSLTAMVNADIVITSFADSTANPGVDTTVNFGSIQKFIRGQVILIADEVAYDGVRTNVRVADDQQSFDINVVFSTSGAGTLKITRITSTAHGMVEGETHTILGTTSYNETEKNLFVTDNTFDISVAFVADDATGTVVSTGRNEKSINVSAIANGAQKDSNFLAFGEMNGNTTVTTVVSNSVYQAIVLTGFAANAVTERWTLTDATAGIFTYNGSKPFTGKMMAAISTTKSGATINYRFTMSVNGAIPVFATAKFAPVEIATPKALAILVAPVDIVNGDTVQIMVARESGTTNPTITDLVIEISE